MITINEFLKYYETSVLMEDISSPRNQAEVLGYKQKYPGINMLNNYGVQFKMIEVCFYTKQNRDQSNKRTRNKNNNTKHSNKIRKGSNQNYTRYFQPNEKRSLMNS